MSTKSPEGLPPSPNDQNAEPSELLKLRIEIVRDDVIRPLGEQPDFNFMQAETLEVLGQTLGKDQVVDLPTRSGKSHMIRRIAVKAAEQDLQTAIVTHRNHIVQEHADELEVLTGERPGSIFDDTDQPMRISVDTISKLLYENRGVEEVTPHENVDLVMIDEVHRALGERTRVVVRDSFPDATRIVFTATPDFKEDRSVTDEYGAKVVSKSPVEAIERGIANPLRIFVYQTDGVIDNLTPRMDDFTAKELKRLADLMARNRTIADMTEDLVNDGRQGIISTIPGEDLIHAERLKAMIEKRYVRRPGVLPRPIRAAVVRGGEPQKTRDALEAYEDGWIDVLLFCDLLTEGWTSNKASFFINGRPTTSIVNLTQMLGRIGQLKEREGIAIDFIDRSVGKKQRTLLEVLELNRSIQGTLVGPRQVGEPKISEAEGRRARESFMRGLFRYDISEALFSVDNALIAELLYTRRELEEMTPYQRRQLEFAREQRREFARESRKWGSLLVKEGLAADQPDYFNVHRIALPQLKRQFQDDHAEDSDPEPPLGVELTVSPQWRTAFERQVGILGVHGEYPDVTLQLPAIPASEVIDTWAASSSRGAVMDDDKPMDVGLEEALIKAMSDLTDKEREIINLRFGLDGGQPQTINEVGVLFDVTQERIRQIESKTLAKLRHPMRSDYIHSFVRDASDRRRDSRTDPFPYPPTAEERRRKEEKDRQEAVKRQQYYDEFVAQFAPDVHRTATVIASAILAALQTDSRARQLTRDYLELDIEGHIKAQLKDDLARTYVNTKIRESRSAYASEFWILDAAQSAVNRKLKYVDPKRVPRIFHRQALAAANQTRNLLLHVQPRYRDADLIAKQVLRKMFELPVPPQVKK